MKAETIPITIPIYVLYLNELDSGSLSFYSPSSVSKTMSITIAKLTTMPTDSKQKICSARNMNASIDVNRGAVLAQIITSATDANLIARDYSK